MAASESKRSEIARAHIGTMGWSYTFWRGQLYPTGLKPKEFLMQYAKRFNSVELDSTFYRIPSAYSAKIWREDVPEGFLFSAKFPRVVTHLKMLHDCEREVNVFIRRISELRDKLGPLLLQFPSSFGVEKLPRLQEFLSKLPKGFRYAVEVRNKTLQVEKLKSLLRDQAVALVVVNQPVLENEITADFVYVRCEGDRSKVKGTLGKVEVDRSEDIEKWAFQARELLNRQLEVFGYFSKYYSGYPPNDADRLLKSLLKDTS
jgi:uncharacterized protein YecE (DUF72 family)